jgi:hypothetical protein
MCQGIDASNPIMGTAIQHAWLRKVIGYMESARGASITCMIFSIPFPSPYARSDPFDSCVIGSMGSGPALAYKAGLMVSTLRQDIAAATCWVCIVM